ncbi:hypothetical protein LQ953_13290 [Sphingomonas sp. IC-56]|uniref:hypothetical protein n=1 Tax=Sphingomonas sp. IC-56 TaxID=2898529 RepID=UPI001E2F4525|nr:hypothetical protein [Sphingomonas sp. IC-56]MCD2324992.1 hypothetical protein [Sphingomonas sp. IC-56]
MSWKGIDPSKWAGNKEALLTALLRNSVQALAKEASTTIPNGGRVPVKNGNLARSVIIDDKPPVKGVPGQEYSASDLELGVSKLQPGKPAYVGWQAEYSHRQNYGFTGEDSLGRHYNQAGHGFAEAAAAKWPAIVAEQAAKLKR